jgi:hypothetical protein
MWGIYAWITFTVRFDSVPDHMENDWKKNENINFWVFVAFAFAFALAVFGFLSVQKAEAAVLQQTSDALEAVVDVSNDEWIQTFNIFATTTPLNTGLKEKSGEISGTISSISIKVRPTQTDSKYTFRFVRLSNNLPTTSVTLDTILDFESCGSIATTTPINQIATITRTFAPHTLDPNKGYFIQGRVFNTACTLGGRRTNIFGNTGNPYPNGESWKKTENVRFAIGDTFDFYFVTDASFTEPATNEIAITLPVYNATSTDFWNFKVQGKISSSTIEKPKIIAVLYSTSTSKLTPENPDTYFDVNLQQNVFRRINQPVTGIGLVNGGIFTNLELFKYEPLAQGQTWYAKAYIYEYEFPEGTYTIFASSTMISFGVNAPLPPPPSEDWIFTSIGSLTCTKFPFAYVCDFLDAIKLGSNVAAGTFPAIVLNFPLMGNITVFSSSTITSVFGSENVQLFRNLIAASLWIGFGYAVYRRALHIFDKQNS